jgi:hypothetical protein
MSIIARRLRRALLPSYVDELLYAVTRSDRLPEVACSVPLTVHRETRRSTRYTAVVDGHPVHVSVLFGSIFLPRLFGFPGDVPCIGQCKTDEACRGKRIYPYMLQYIAREVFATSRHGRIYILVSPSNKPSIRGIESAGFTFVARLRGWRLGPLIVKRG